MEDYQIIELFFARSESAIAETDSKYGKICQNLSRNILHNRQDAEECVNDAYLALWNTIPPNRPSPLVTFLCKIVRNLSLKRYEKNIAKKRNSMYDAVIDEIAPYLVSETTVEDEIAAKELTHIIEDFLQMLSAENRVMFLRRYYFSDPYDTIARQLGITEKNVSVRLTRIRKQMKKYLTERGVLF